MPSQHLLYRMGNSKQLVSTAARVHWTLPSGSTLYSVKLLGLAGLGEHGLGREYGDGAALRLSSCTRQSRLLNTVLSLYSHTMQ